VKRRNFLIDTAVTVAGAAIATDSLVGHSADPIQKQVNLNRVRQSVMGWCFKPMSGVELAKHCKTIGLEAIEGIPADDYPEVTKLGLKISLVGSHGFADGPLDPENHALVETKLRDGIDLAVRFGAPNVITFTGMKKTGISDDAAKRNCLEAGNGCFPTPKKRE
jgi:hydroxypyruvate isomerase